MIGVLILRHYKILKKEEKQMEQDLLEQKEILKSLIEEEKDELGKQEELDET